jgi:hypothetical protein
VACDTCKDTLAAALSLSACHGMLHLHQFQKPVCLSCRTCCRLELAFNGNGALLASDSPATILQEWDGSCSTSPQYRQLGCQGADSTQEAYAASQTGSKHPFCMNCRWRLWGVCLLVCSCCTVFLLREG